MIEQEIPPKRPQQLITIRGMTSQTSLSVSLRDKVAHLYNTAEEFFIVFPSTEALPHRKPPSAGISRGSCGTHGKSKRNALYKLNIILLYVSQPADLIASAWNFAFRTNGLSHLSTLCGPAFDKTCKIVCFISDCE
jgi:hypothetical protein